MHKHFRMVAIAEYMKSQGYATANDEHTRIPGIWKKLESLYNLPALDERVSANNNYKWPFIQTPAEILRDGDHS